MIAYGYTAYNCFLSFKLKRRLDPVARSHRNKQSRMLWFLSQLCQWPGGLLQAIASKWTSVEDFKALSNHHKSTKTTMFSFPKKSSLKTRFFFCSHVLLCKCKFLMNKSVCNNHEFFPVPQAVFPFSHSFSVVRDSQSTGQALLVFCVSYQCGLQTSASEIPDLLLVLQLRKHINISLF